MEGRPGGHLAILGDDLAPGRNDYGRIVDLIIAKFIDQYLRQYEVKKGANE